MENLNTQITEHYSSGMLLEGFRQGLRRAGADLDALSYEDLAGGDEFHVGATEATDRLLDQLEIAEDAHVLDIGAGVGGVARRAAHRCGCRVTGVDVTPELIETARALTEMVAMDDVVEFVVASGTDLPLEDASVDAALMLHVAMNIEDKPALFREAARVLRPGSTFAVYDVMEGAEPGPLTFPLPWSSVAETSFVAPRAEYVAAAEAAGLTPVAERDRWQYGYDFWRRVVERATTEGLPPVGPHLFMGDAARQMMKNALDALAARRIAPVEMFFRKAAA
jgi:ubiquinone/menaquinone biosynthesis C-methylase UbiE